MPPSRVIAALIVILVASPFVFAGYALLARFVLHGEVTASSLTSSVREEAGASSYSGGLDGCRRTEPPREWECGFVPPGGSGGTIVYRVVVRDGSSCWDARRVEAQGERKTPRRVDGCVHLWQWSLL